MVSFKVYGLKNKIREKLIESAGNLSSGFLEDLKTGSLMNRGENLYTLTVRLDDSVFLRYWITNSPKGLSVTNAQIKFKMRKSQRSSSGWDMGEKINSSSKYLSI